MMEDITVYFDYQTHMDKTPVIRWCKQETELFYQVVVTAICKGKIEKFFPLLSVGIIALFII